MYLDDRPMGFGRLVEEKDDVVLSCILTTMASLGLKVNLEKGERSMQVTWVGVEFKLQPPHFGASHQLAREVPYRAPGPAEGLGSKGNDRHERTTKGSGKSFMVGWSAGCARWTTPILYGALFDQEDAVEKGIEEARRQQREDSRDKSRLIPLKRIEHARSWLVEYLAAALASLKPNQASAKILITLRTGAILVVNGRVTKALASPVTAAEDSKLLNFELGSSASQGIVETLVILVALRHWEKLLLNVRGDHHRPVGLGDSTLDRPKVCEQQQGPKLLGATLTPVRIPGTAKKPESWATTELPKELSGLQIETLAGRPKEWYILEPLATEEAEGWGEATALTAAWAPRHWTETDPAKLCPKARWDVEDGKGCLVRLEPHSFGSDRSSHRSLFRTKDGGH